ncbi:unnamed protein product [Choristocarpus tenellus]
MKMLEISASNRTLTIDKLPTMLVEMGLMVSSSKLHCWLEAMGATRVHRCVTCSLSFSHKKYRVHFILSQISRNRKTYSTGLNIVHIDEAWFYLIHERETARMFVGRNRWAQQTFSTRVIFLKWCSPPPFCTLILPMISTARVESDRFA